MKGGYTYCALGALSLLGRLHPTHEPGRVQSPEKFVRWLVQRQMPYLEEEEGEDGAAPSELRKPHTSDASPLVGGFHGRCNKKLDTCYSFWVGGGLDVRICSTISLLVS